MKEKKSILIIGVGRFGRHIAEKLYELGHEVMAVDMSEERISEIAPKVTKPIIGDSTNKQFLESLGIRDFDACIVTIGDNFQNSLETTYLLHELGAKRVIARASRGMQEKFLLNNGADEVVYPEKQLASWTAIRCTSDHIKDYIELKGDIDIYEMSVPGDWCGKTVIQLDIRRKYNLNIIALRKNGVLTMITPDAVMSSDCPVLVLGTIEAVRKCFKF